MIRNGITGGQGDEQNVVLADGRKCKAKGGLKAVTIKIGEHKENVDFSILALNEYDAILGMPWLEKNNPSVDFRKRTIELDSSRGIIRLNGIDVLEDRVTKPRAYYIDKLRARRRIMNCYLITSKQVKAQRKNIESLYLAFIRPTTEIQATENSNQLDEMVNRNIK